jgi:hypothetical protein
MPGESSALHDRQISWRSPPTGLRHLQLSGRLGDDINSLPDHNVDLLALNSLSLSSKSPLQAVAMTVLLPSGRILSRNLVPRSGPLLTRLTSTHQDTRVSIAKAREYSSASAQGPSTQPRTFSLPIRTYATVESKPVGRPKAHTGRTTAKRTTTAAPKKKAAAKKKPAAKKAKPKAKAKAKPKPKPKKKVSKQPTAATLARRERKEVSDLKKKALLTGAPKGLPDTAWAVCFVENGPKKGEAVDKSGTTAKRAAQVYRNLSAEEREV